MDLLPCRRDDWPEKEDACDQDQQPLHIHDLSEDCLLHIFSFVTNLREKIRLNRVCRIWSLIVYRSLAYHHTELIRPDQLYFDGELGRLRLHPAPAGVRKQELPGEQPAPTLHFRFPLGKILLYCRNLRRLHNVTERLRSEYDWQLAEHGLPSLPLVELRIQGDDSLSDATLAPILSRCPRLERLDLVDCRLVDGRCLKQLSASLRDLRLAGCPIETGRLNDWIRDRGANLRSISLNCRTLRINCVLPNLCRVCPDIQLVDLFQPT